MKCFVTQIPVNHYSKSSLEQTNITSNYKIGFSVLKIHKDFQNFSPQSSTESVFVLLVSGSITNAVSSWDLQPQMVWYSVKEKFCKAQEESDSVLPLGTRPKRCGTPRDTSVRVFSLRVHPEARYYTNINHYLPCRNVCGYETSCAWQCMPSVCLDISNRKSLLSAIHTGCLYPPGDTSGTHFCQRLSRPHGHNTARRISGKSQ